MGAARGRHPSVVRDGLLAWGFLDQHHALVGVPFDSSYGEADAVGALDAIVMDVLGPSLAAAVENRVVCDLGGAALIDASTEADLLVVGLVGWAGYEGC
jgi:hypothetical protein